MHNNTIDRKFILALQERWRPETHTFHLPIGECTVTLEDVYMLLGLSIDGKAVNGSVQHANSLCERVLGRDLVVPTQGSRGQGISLASLRAYYDDLVLSDNSTEETRLPRSAPSMDVRSSYKYGVGGDCLRRNNYTFPYATRFCGPKLDYSKNPRGSVILYRDLIDHLRAEDFNWRPYLMLYHEPNESDREVWTAVTPIIRFNIVEMHQSDRVRLQFGMHQPIPDPPTDLGRWHIKRVNQQWDHADYRTFAPEFCEMWKQRRSRLLQFPVGQLPMFPTADYVAWFRTVTTPDMMIEMVTPNCQFVVFVVVTLAFCFHVVGLGCFCLVLADIKTL
ncbi:serine/threonine-protein phosphatase 7 long form homolog [Vicia villosa]|uniref:serine/threonine-protein phosphatase 7 long form homolog n=1 Tax=Vicia villosa TaxID=3911 RepID=UPI00273A93BD|nr:serine/threonine-protein phosphatase 7 long form homolog [Vicia villosa]